MADKLEEIRQLASGYSPVDERRFTVPHSLLEKMGRQVPWLLKRLEAAERYIESDIDYDAAVQHAEYSTAAAAKHAQEKALERWVAAKEAT